MNLLYVKVAIGALLLCGCFYGYVEHSRFEAFKREVQVAAQKQEAKNEAIEAQHALINKGITNEYEAKLAAVRNFYSGGVRNPSSGAVSGISPAPKGTDAETAYPILVRQCAETTVMVNLWQEWANQNGLIK